jgi:hypothetical protein
VSALAALTPYELAEAVLDVLRAAERPLSAHATAEALLAAAVPHQLPDRTECVHTSTRQVSPVLDGLVRDDRARRRDRGGVDVYEATCPTPEIEMRINVLEASLGGRPVRVESGGPDPVVTVTAPLSRIEAIGR